MPKAISFSGDAEAAAAVRELLALASDQARLDALKSTWTNQTQPFLDALVRECAKELDRQANEYISSAGAISAAVHSSLRSLLGLISLLSRREYPARSGSARSLPEEVFPGVLSSLVLLVESLERPVTGASASTQAHAVKYHALHAYNRFLEAFPPIAGLFAPTLVQQCTRALFPADASAAPVEPAFGTKLLETIGLIAATLPATMVATSHTLLKQSLELIAMNLAEIESFEPETLLADDASNERGAKKAPAPLQPVHQFTLALLDFASTLIRKLHVRLPLAYPSSRMLHPRAWPFGSEELGERDDDEEEGDDEKEDDNAIEEEDDDDEEENGSSPNASASAPAPRQCYTEQLVFNPARRGAVAMAFASAEEASMLLGQILDRFLHFFAKVGREGPSSSSPGVVNDHGTTILQSMPLVVALDNMCGVPAEHTKHVDTLVNGLLDHLRDVDFAEGGFKAASANAVHQILTAMEGVLKHASREAPGCVDAMPMLYNDLVNWLSDMQAVFPRAAFIKLRRYAVATFLAVLYVMDTSFQALVGSQAFFQELFPLLANPLLTSHLVWILRSEPEHLTKKVLPQVMRGLLNTNTRSSPSMKTVGMILTSIGNVACFTRAIATPSATTSTATTDVAKPTATLPLLESYLGQIVETIIGTMEKSPSGTGQIASLVLCRIVLAGYDMPIVQSYIARVLALYLHILDESLFVAEQAELGEEYDEDDQDLVSQLQYCVLDMLHVMFQDLHEASSDPIARGVPDAQHPFDQARFVQIMCDDSDAVEVIRDVVSVLLANTAKPTFFNDDAALRNSEIHLVKEILAHANLLPLLFAASETTDATDANEPPGAVALPPLTSTSFVVTLLQSTLAAKEDGQAERKYNYVECFAAITIAINANPERQLQMTVKEALQAATNARLLADVKRDVELSKALKHAGWLN